MKVSIIIPVYNAQNYIRRCMESILNQTFSDFEVLLIDDGSSDNTGEICDEYRTNKKVKVIHKRNGGSASARNMGLQVATGEYISFIDADDYVSPKFLETLVYYAEYHDADIVQCGFIETCDNYMFADNSLHHKKREFTNIEFLHRFCEKQYYISSVVLWNKLYKKDMFVGLRFPEGKGVDDDYLICKLLYRAKKIVEIDTVLYCYFQSPNSQMRSAPSLKRLDGIDAVKSQLDFFNEIGELSLHNSLKFRYYAVLIDGYYYVKKFFPEEEQLINKLEMDCKKYVEIFGIREVSMEDKINLFIRYRFNKLFEIIRKKRG